MGIYLYPADFDYDNYAIANHGKAELTPKSCVVKEIAGGDYSLTMVHPYDPGQKWIMMRRGDLIRSPVPKTPVPPVTVEGTQQYLTLRATNLYSRVRTIALENALDYQLLYNPLGMQWKKRKQYYTGDCVTYGFRIVEGGIPHVFRATEDNINEQPEIDSSSREGDSPWEDLGELDSWHFPTDDGVVISTIPANEVVMKISDFIIGFVYVERSNGERGYVQSFDLTDASSWPSFPVTAPDGMITEQFFRIYEIKYNDKDRTVTVQARHVSYDQRRNTLYPCNLKEETAQTAIANIIGKRADATIPMKVYSNLTDDDIDVDWSFENPIQALLDPDEGLVGKTNAKVIRDNNVFYVLQNTDNSHGFEIRYGKNLLGVTITTNDDDVVTRILPVADDGFDGYLFYRNPTTGSSYVDANNLYNYPFPRVETLKSEYYVGQEITKANGTTKTLGVIEVQAKMNKEANARFNRDKVHLESFSLDVDFLMLGDTEEYKQYRGLETLCMYDSVNIITGPSGQVLTNFVQVTGYEYDAIICRYNRITLTRIQKKKKKNGTVGGYLIASNSVTYGKLSNSALRRLKRG